MINGAAPHEALPPIEAAGGEPIPSPNANELPPPATPHVTPSLTDASFEHLIENSTSGRVRATINGVTRFGVGGKEVDEAAYNAAESAGVPDITPGGAGGSPPVPPSPPAPGGTPPDDSMQSAYMRAKIAALGGRLDTAGSPAITDRGPLANLTAPGEGLSVGDRASNAVRGALDKPAKYHPIVTPIMENGAALRDTLRSQAVRVAEGAKSTYALFKHDNQGRVILADGSKMPMSDLAQRVVSDPGGVAQLLTPEQRFAVSEDMTKIGAFRQQAERAGIDIPELGGYLPRGTPTREGLIDRIKGAGGGKSGGKVGSEKARVYDTQEQGIANGENYPEYPKAVADSLGSLSDRIAAAQTAEILKPLGTTAGERVPEGVRNDYNSAKYLAQRLAGRLDTAEGRAGTANATADELARNLEKQATGSTLPIHPDRMQSDIHVVNNFITQAQQRIVELRQRGGQSATDAANYQSMLDDAKAHLDAISPTWQEAKATASATPRGQGQINLAPLQGHAFPNDIANAANTALEGDKPLGGPLVQGVSNALNTTRTIMDFATVTRLAAAGVMHPGAAVQSLGTAVKSVFGHPEALGDVMADLDAKAALGQGKSTSELVRDYGITVTPSGQTGGLTNLPVVGKPIAATSRFIGTYSNALRLRAASEMADIYEKAGLINSDADKLALGHAINLATGEGKPLFGQAGYGLVNFPKWLGAQLEFVQKAATDGTLTGAYARESLAKLAGMGIVTTYAANAAQGKSTEWKDGVPVMWVGSSKVNPFGGWGTLIKAGGKISPVSPDRELFSGDSDMLQKPDLAYLARSKGSPVVSILTDLVKGSSFSGIAPSLTDPEYLARSIAPYTLANVGKESPATWGLNAVGARATDQTATDKLNEIAQQRYGKDFYSTEPFQQDAIKKDQPSIWNEHLDNASAATKQAVATKAGLLTQQTAADSQLMAGKLSPKDWQDQRTARLNQLKGAESIIYPTKQSTPPTDPSQFDAYIAGGATPRDRFFRAIDAYADPGTGQPDWTAVDQWQAAQPQADQDYIARNTGLGGTPLEKLRRTLSADYYGMPEYTATINGHTMNSADGSETNALMAAVHANTKSIPGQTVDPMLYLATLQKMAASGKVDKTSTAYLAAQRSFLGLLPANPARDAYRRAHPEVALLSSPTALTPDQIAAVQKRLGNTQEAA